MEVITELREGDGEEDPEVPGSQASTHSATPSRPRGVPRISANMDPEEKMKAALIDLRCLIICIGMLERINSVSFARSCGEHLYHEKLG